jgi:hypothetical protein
MSIVASSPSVHLVLVDPWQIGKFLFVFISFTLFNLLFCIKIMGLMRSFRIRIFDTVASLNINLSFAYGIFETTVWVV